jgi:flagellar motor protein MotB
LLIKKGIHPDRLDFKGFNRTVPVVYPEVTEEDQQRNRRVDVVFSKLN